MRKNITICSIDDVTNEKTWSGTHFNVYKQFEKRGVLRGIFNFAVNNFFVRLLNKVFYLRPGTRDFFTSKSYEKKLLKFFEQNTFANDDVFFYISEYSIPAKLQHKVKHAAYIDATLKGILKYQQSNTIKVKPYLNFFFSRSKSYLQRLNYIFTMNEWSRKSLIEDYGIDANKIFNVGFGINLKPYHGEKDYTNHEILIVLRKGLEKLKGLELLLEALPLVQADFPDTKLNVVGTTYTQANGVEYFENYPRTKTIELFQRCSLYAMPALYEPNGITYLESLSNKAPILGLDRFAFPEFSNYGEFGYIVPEADHKSIAQAIITAFRSPEKMKKMGEEGQRYALNKYDWNTVGDAIMNTLTT